MRSLTVVLLVLVAACSSGSKKGAADPTPPQPEPATTDPTPPADESPRLDAAACTALYERVCAHIFSIDPIEGEVEADFMVGCRNETAEAVATCPQDPCAPDYVACLDLGEASYACHDAHAECAGQ